MLCGFEVLYIRIDLRFKYQGGHSNLKIALFEFLVTYNRVVLLPSMKTGAIFMAINASTTLKKSKVGILI